MIIRKISRTSLAVLVSTAMLGFASCKNYVPKENSEIPREQLIRKDRLKRFNADKELIYSDFKEFLYSKGKKVKHFHPLGERYLYLTKAKDIDYISELNINPEKDPCYCIGPSNVRIRRENHGETPFTDRFTDEKFNGVDSYESQVVGFPIDNDVRIFNPSVQSKIAEEYIETLKKIMHQARYKNY